MRKAVQKENVLPGTDLFPSLSSVLADCRPLAESDYELSPLAKEVEEFLIPATVARRHLHDAEQFMELMHAINEFLCREVSTIEKQDLYRSFIAQGDANALLAAGMVSDRVVMPKLVALWKCCGGAKAFAAEVKEHRQHVTRQVDRAIEAGVLNVCASCGDTSTPSKLKCSGCSKVWYCNAGCQHSHWKAHKQSCKAVSSIR